jgi:hypothetical protein
VKVDYFFHELFKICAKGVTTIIVATAENHIAQRVTVCLLDLGLLCDKFDMVKM